MGYLCGDEEYFTHELRGHLATTKKSERYALDFRNGSGANTLPPPHNASYGKYSSVVFAQEVAIIATHHAAGRRPSHSSSIWPFSPFMDQKRHRKAISTSTTWSTPIGGQYVR